jgi:hypothetical protein
MKHHKTVASQLPCWCCGVLPKNSHKSAIYGEGSGPKRQPEGPKSAISEKELAIFELRKVLFSEKHLGEASETAPYLSNILFLQTTISIRAEDLRNSDLLHRDELTEDESGHWGGLGARPTVDNTPLHISTQIKFSRH